jgi:hypothetical protein
MDERISSSIALQVEGMGGRGERRGMRRRGGGVSG